VLIQPSEPRFQTSFRRGHAVLTFNDLKVSASFRSSLSRIYPICLMETSMLTTCAINAFTPFRSSAMFCSCHDRLSILLNGSQNFSTLAPLRPQHNTDEFMRTAESAFLNSRLFDQSSQKFLPRFSTRESASDKHSNDSTQVRPFRPMQEYGL
jgi:hypothetical protein